MPEPHDPSDPKLRSWIHVPAASDFSIQNLPFGVFEARERPPRVGVAIGDSVVDLAELTALGYLAMPDAPPPTVFSEGSLNAFLAAGKPCWQAVRRRVSRLLSADDPELRDRGENRERVILNQKDVTMRLPVEAGDFVDFYSSIEHATNVGKMFRPDNPLLPNWRHLPVGYHGRTSSLIVSGRDVHRPKGQMSPANGTPEFGPSRCLDFELEVGFIVGRRTQLGESISTTAAEDFIFGLVLVNDWSARDIQRWEYVPLGPFLGKSFATSVSPWVVTLDALAPFRTSGPVQDPPVLPYLQFEGARNLDLQLEVLLRAEGLAEAVAVSRANFRHMYWNMAQQLAHLTSNGTNIRVGDLCASGTVSGPEPESYGSMLELTWNGARPLALPGGVRRSFLEDGDTVIMRGYAERQGVRVGFGELRGKVLPAK